MAEETRSVPIFHATQEPSGQGLGILLSHRDHQFPATVCHKRSNRGQRTNQFPQFCSGGWPHTRDHIYIIGWVRLILADNATWQRLTSSTKAGRDVIIRPSLSSRGHYLWCTLPHHRAFHHGTVLFGPSLRLCFQKQFKLAQRNWGTCFDHNAHPWVPQTIGNKNAGLVQVCHQLIWHWAHKTRISIFTKEDITYMHPSTCCTPQG